MSTGSLVSLTVLFLASVVNTYMYWAEPDGRSCLDNSGCDLNPCMHIIRALLEEPDCDKTRKVVNSRCDTESELLNSRIQTVRDHRYTAWFSHDFISCTTAHFSIKNDALLLRNKLPMFEESTCSYPACRMTDECLTRNVRNLGNCPTTRMKEFLWAQERVYTFVKHGHFCVYIVSGLSN